MAFLVIDPVQFFSDGIFKEDVFLAKTAAVDWSMFAREKVLIRGCNSVVIPPWAFMYLTGRLAPIAKTVLYGNEHDNIVVFRQAKSS